MQSQGHTSRSWNSVEGRGGGGVAVFQTAVLYICVNKLFEFRSGTKTAEISIFYQLSKGTQL